MIHVDAALNGGNFTIEADRLKLADDRPIVRMGVHGDRHLLYPDEARRLALALIEVAALAERPDPIDWP